MTEFSDFTKLVLDRMESNPEEFFTVNQGYTRWQGLVRGLEAMARGDCDSREYHILWPLTDTERATLLNAYRKLYLNELHRDMLKNIVSGDDKHQYTMSVDRGYQAGIGKSATIGPATVTSSAYTVAASGSTISPSLTLGDTKLTEGDVKKLKKILVTHTDHAMAKKMGMDVMEYIKRRDAA